MLTVLTNRQTKQSLQIRHWWITFNYSVIPNFTLTKEAKSTACMTGIIIPVLRINNNGPWYWISSCWNQFPVIVMVCEVKHSYPSQFSICPVEFICSPINSQAIYTTKKHTHSNESARGIYYMQWYILPVIFNPVSKMVVIIDPSRFDITMVFATTSVQKIWPCLCRKPTKSIHITQMYTWTISEPYLHEDMA